MNVVILVFNDILVWDSRTDCHHLLNKFPKIFRFTYIFQMLPFKLLFSLLNPLMLAPFATEVRVFSAIPPLTNLYYSLFRHKQSFIPLLCSSSLVVSRSYSSSLASKYPFVSVYSLIYFLRAIISGSLSITSY